MVEQQQRSHNLVHRFLKRTLVKGGGGGGVVVTFWKTKFLLNLEKQQGAIYEQVVSDIENKDTH